jgi:hypothetical protein
MCQDVKDEAYVGSSEMLSGKEKIKHPMAEVLTQVNEEC